MAETASSLDRAVLLVEDNQLNELVALGLLRLLGLQADVARDGAQAYEAVREGSYRVVLMDVAMPVLDGVAATRRIRSDLPPDKQPYIIAVTAHNLSEDRERCLAAGMDDYLTKPLTKVRLQKALTRVGSL